MYEGYDHMGPRASVFMAEIRAITTVAHTLMQQKGQDILIRSDSQAAIKAISSTTIDSKTVDECRRLLNRLGASNKVTIAWVKAHAKHAGNELADHLAKLGAEQVIGPARFKYYEANASFSYYLLAKSNQMWQSRWDSQPTHKYIQSKFFINNIQENKNKFNFILKHSNRITVGKLIQFLTGHCNLNYHLNHSNNFIETKCRKCGLGPETPVHLLRSCEALNQARRDIFDGHDILPEGFVWNIPQIIRFLQQETDLWELLDQLK
jgi:ribonuclease HI